MRNLILSALILASVFQTALGEQSGDWTYTVSNNQATIMGYTGSGGEVTVPNLVQGVPVVQVGEITPNSFSTPIFGWSNQTVTSVTIPESVTSIGHQVFYTCTRLTSVSLPNNLAVIGDRAFANCPSLTNINIPNSVTTMGYGVFEYCSSLTNITIPNSVTSIGSNAFNYCTGLTSITILNRLTNVDDWSFYQCTSLPAFDGFRYITWGNEISIVKYLGSDFLVTVPSLINGRPVTKLLGNVFVESGSTLIGVSLPDSLTRIGSGAFSGCTGLTSITIPNSVTDIGQSAFSGCTGLTSIAIPNGVASVSQYTFDSCTSLISVNIPSSVTSIGYRAFFQCNQLASIIIPNGVTSIGQGAFSNCSKLSAVSIPQTVKDIGRSAFANCFSLKAVTIPNSVTSIGDNAFGEEMMWGDLNQPHNFDSVNIPERFLTDFARMGFKGPAAAAALISGIADNLAQNDAFITALANKIIARNGNYGLSIKSELESLATKAEVTSSLTQSRADGINSVLSNPNLWTLYTTSQIQNMAVGDLVLTRQVSGGFVLNYDIEQSADLQTWTTYAPLSLPLTGLPTDKAFVRIKVINSTPNPPFSPPTDPSATPTSSNL